MAEKSFIYQVPDARAAATAIRELDPMYQGKLVGLAVFARGFKDNPEEFFVFANLESPTADDASMVVGVLESHGRMADLTFDMLFQGNPRPHFVASGLGEQILASIRAYYPNADPGPEKPI
ncbi:MAG TPA: hypothetical protein VGV60_08290 [Candidatus Polarisedimenticolia bacterium]|nr:hypothetical protein [Candidatus Polarisedimenticolia bacterium]